MRNNYKKVSSHGSINIPVDMRREIGIQGGDPMEVSLRDGVVTVRPYTPRCVICGTSEKIIMVSGKGLCIDCMEKAFQEKEGKDESSRVAAAGGQ
jgi:transcriptional pleiotropic regulator of transition state genes